jgi:hypothetical protein
MRQKGKEWKDHNGREVPTYAINPVLRKEDVHSHNIVKLALKAEEYLTKVVELTRQAHKEIYMAKMADANLKGNKTPSDGMTINAFDQSVQVKITMPDNMYFDNTYTKMVKEKFDEYFDMFMGDNEELIFMRDLVNDLLYTSGGKLDNNRVLKLRKYRERILASKKLSPKSEKFIEAVDLFDKAIKTKPGNMGIYIDIREDGKARRVALKYTDI